MIAAVVGLEDDLSGGTFPVVGDVEEAFAVVEQFLLPLGDFQILPHHNHPVRLAAQRRRIFELGDVLFTELDVFELPLFDDPLLDILRPPAGLGFDRLARPAFQTLPSTGGEIFRHFIQVGHGVDTEDELHTVGIPAVQVRRLGEVGVAPQGDLTEAGPTAQGDGSIQIEGCVLVAGAVAAAVDQVQRLAGVGQ